MTGLRPLFLDAFEGSGVPQGLAHDLAAECDTIADAYQHLESCDDGVIHDGHSYGLGIRQRARRTIEDEFSEFDYLRQFALVGCSSSKNPGVLPAREKYDTDSSPYWKWKRAFGETVADRYWILSAEYGVLAPTQYIGDYDRSLSDMNAEETEAWAREVGGSIKYEESFWQKHEGGELKSRWYDEIVVVAGQSYVNPIRGVLDGLPVDVRYLFEDDDGNPAYGGIGAQTSELKRLVGESHAERRTYEGSAGQTRLSALADGGQS